MNDFLLLCYYRASVAQTAQAYWWSDGTPVLLHSIINSFIFSVPLYILAGLRRGNGNIQSIFSCSFY